jgi:YD repeat-containing protein
MSFDYDGLGRLVQIVDTLDRTNTVIYDGNGFIIAVTDFSGRQVRYEYYGNGDPDGSFGDLKLAISPAVTGTPNANDFPGGKTNRYTYSKGSALNALNHNLLTITDANGQTWLSNRYNATLAATNINFDRVEVESLGLTFDKIKFVYLPQSPNINNGGATQKTIVNDRVGNMGEYFYDAGNRLVLTRAYTGRADPAQPTTEAANLAINPLRNNDPAFFETLWEYNADSLVTRVTQPNGNVTEHEYETNFDPNAARRSRGNLRVRRQLPGPLGGDQAVLLEQFEYDTGFGGCGCGFNFVTKYTDARTNVTLHSYDARGNRTNTVHRISSITEQWEYNAFGQLTAQVMPDNGSGHRRRDEFTHYTSGPATGYLHERIADTGGFALTNTYEYDAVGNAVRSIDPHRQHIFHLQRAQPNRPPDLCGNDKWEQRSLPARHLLRCQQQRRAVGHAEP